MNQWHLHQGLPPDVWMMIYFLFVAGVLLLFRVF